LKYAPYVGIAAALLLIVCCFFPWTYYPDLQENFTGFYSKQNQYGKPGKTFIFLCVVAIVLFLIPKLWSRRTNQFVGVVIFAYAMKTYFIFTACYTGICPQIKAGLVGVLLCSIFMLISSLLSKAKIMSNQ
jgi:hypothetical protein